MNDIRAIETSYAGCRFRSRLEARWAVFFDTLGIPWEYESEGITCTWRLSLHEGTFNYLPDFYLPTLDLWAEVKGALSRDEHIRLINAAAHLSAGGGGGCGYDNPISRDMLVLGPIYRPARWDTWQPQPVRLHMHKGDLLASPWPGGMAHNGRCIARDVGDGGRYGIFEGDLSEPKSRELLLSGIKHDGIGHGYVEALVAARSARFEHGESG